MNENQVLAVVNGKEITQEDVQGFLSQLNPQVAMQFQSKEGMEKVVEELVSRELLYFESIEKGLDNDEIFKRELEIIKANILKQYAVTKLLSDVKATDEEIEDYYNKYKEYFNTPESVRASHILVKDEQKAREIINEIKNGLEFEEAAKKYSMCPSKGMGGDLGEFTKGKMVKEFEDAAFELEVGVVSEPVKTQFGYHIIKVQDHKEKRISTLEEAREKVSAQVLLLKQQEKYLDKTEELKGKYEVKYNF